MRPQGSPAELERRRVQAIELLNRGLQVHQVADRLGIDCRSVRRWKRAYRKSGPKGLRAKPAPGRPPKLTLKQRRRLVQWILKGPQAFGFKTALWTCQRIVRLLKDRLHVTYHPDHIGRLLRSLGLTPQRPQQVAREHNDRRIRLWTMQDFSRIKKNLPA